MENTITDINIDMIRSSRRAHTNSNNYVYVIELQTACQLNLNNITTDANKNTFKWNFIYKYND
jgi:prephenate dehydratase